MGKPNRSRFVGMQLMQKDSVRGGVKCEAKSQRVDPFLVFEKAEPYPLWSGSRVSREGSP